MSLVPKYCTYISRHPTGAWYAGKGITSKVLNGEYKGSGVAFKLALEHPNFGWDTWTTTVLNTFETEDKAYAAEEVLVPITALIDPLCLNQKAGGLKSMNKTRGRLLASLTAQKRREARAVRFLKSQERKAAMKSKQDAIKQRLKDRLKAEKAKGRT